MTYEKPTAMPGLLSALREAKKREFREKAVFQLLSEYLGDRDPSDAEVDALRVALIEHWGDNVETVSTDQVRALWTGCRDLAQVIATASPDEQEFQLGALVQNHLGRVVVPLWTVATGKDDGGGLILGEMFNSAGIFTDGLDAFRYGRSVGECSHCGFPFIAPRARTAYCSTNCKSMAATYRQRAKAKEQSNG